MSNCKFCKDGFLGHRFGADYECVNGVLIDIDVASEGWDPQTDYPPAPCECCPVCGGSGHEEATATCATCNGTGWRSGENESQDRLEEWATP